MDVFADLNLAKAKLSPVKVNPCAKFDPDRPSRLTIYKNTLTCTVAHTYTHITNFIN